MEQHLSDRQLLDAYTRHGSQDAFAQLVRRHANLVYGTARRQMGDPHLAEDVSQAVFVILARKAASLSPSTVLSGWLYNTTIYASANALKTQARRKHHETKRGLMSAEIQTEQSGDAPWQAVAPMLDSALAKLAGRDRDAILLKFIEGKSHREVGAAIGVSEDAARKRINRSLQRLRGFFHKRGVALSITALGGILTTHVAQAAPLSVLASGTAGTAGAMGLAKGTMTMLAWAQAKLVVGCIAALIFLSGGVALTVHVIHQRNVISNTQAAAPLPAPAAPVIPIADQIVPPVPVPAQKPIEGVVIGTNGEPLIDAEVFLATPQTGVNLYSDKQKAPRIITEKDGKFSFPAQPGKDWAVVVRHPDGVAVAYAEDLARSDLVLLKQWGRIEGTLYAATKPLPGETLTIGEWGYGDDPLSLMVGLQTTVKTDQNGHFVLPKVVPGAPMLTHQTFFSSMESSKWDCVEVKPGRTVTVDLGARGRPVVAKITLPPGWEKTLQLKADRNHMWDISARYIAALDPAHPDPGLPTIVQGMQIPILWNMMTARDQHLYREKWDRSPEGITYHRVMFADQTPLRPGGAVRFDVLRPGKYSLAVRALESVPGQNMLEDVAGAYVDVTVPQPPSGAKASEEAFDAGTIQLKPVPRVRINNAAPAMNFTMIGGKPATLADFKGKYLLLHVKPQYLQNDDSDGLKKAWASYKDNKDFAMLTLHLGVKADAAAKIASENEWAWPQAVGSIQETGGVPEAYQRGPGTNFLIDPSGKVITKIFRSDDVDTEIAKAFLERQ